MCVSRKEFLKAGAAFGGLAAASALPAFAAEPSQVMPDAVPDLLTTFDRRRVSTAAQWEGIRVPELLKEFQDEGYELAGGTLYLDEGLLKANSFAAALERIEIQDDAGFDLTAEGSEFGSSSTEIVSENGAHVRLKTGSRNLRSGMRLGTWATGTAPSCSFVLEKDASIAKNYRVAARNDGVYVQSSGLMILVR